MAKTAGSLSIEDRRQLASRSWLKMRKQNTLGRVGNFGQFIAAELLDCEISERWQTEYADIYNRDLGIRVEVKTRDNFHAFGISVKQLVAYEDQTNLPFPIAYTLYALLAYRSGLRRRAGEKKKRGLRSITYSALARKKRVLDQYELLADRMDELYLLDLAVVRALSRKLQVKKNHFVGRDEETIIINRRQLRGFVRDLSEVDLWKQLRLDPRRWIRDIVTVQRPVTVGNRRFSVGYRLIMVLRRSTHEVISPLIDSKVRIAT